MTPTSRDLLRAVCSRRTPDGRLVAHAGDSYVLLVEWQREGRVRSASISPYGSAVANPRSPHHAACRSPRVEWRSSIPENR